MIDGINKGAEDRMLKSVEAFKTELQKIRAGRAHTGLLDQVKVDYYGQMMPINQVASVSALDARTLSVSPWEKGMGIKIDKAIRESNLGLNPVISGDLLRVPLPVLTEERRKEMTKIVRNLSEDAKVAIRNIRREANDQLKKALKEKLIAEDVEHNAQTNIQKLTDYMIGEIDALVKTKEVEIMKV